MTNNEFNIMFNDYGYEPMEQFGTLSKECGVKYANEIRVEEKTTEVNVFFNESVGDDISLSSPECKCLSH